MAAVADSFAVLVADTLAVLYTVENHASEEDKLEGRLDLHTRRELDNSDRLVSRKPLVVDTQ